MKLDPSIALDFWPLFLLQAILAVAALLDMRKRNTLQYLPKIAWVAIILLGNIVGSIAYFLFARGDRA